MTLDWTAMSWFRSSQRTNALDWAWGMRAEPQYNSAVSRCDGESLRL